MGSLLFHGGSCPVSVETTDPDPTRDDSGNLAPKPWPHGHGRAAGGVKRCSRAPSRSTGGVLPVWFCRPSSRHLVGTPLRFRRLCRVAVMNRSLPEGGSKR